MNPTPILVIEDEEDLQELLRFHLARAGYRIGVVASAEEGLKAIARESPALILLDLMLPGMDGIAFLRHLKRLPKTADIGVIVVSARGEERDVVAGLEMGADDYIPKPFKLAELTARVQSVLRRIERRAPTGPETALAVGPLTLNPAKHAVTLEGRPLELSKTEFLILHFLARHPGWVFTRNQIVEGIRGAPHPVTDRSVDVQILNLRRKLGEAGALIETVRGVGYRMREFLEPS